jgi:hypothetical protein
MHKNVEEAKKAAAEVLLYNAKGPYQGLPRTAGWGYPEPYTRDLMIAALGILTTDNQTLINSVRKTLEALAKNQSTLGHIVSLAHDPGDRGASDTTPLFLIALAIFRKVTGEKGFLEEAAVKALKWMEYQSPDDMVMVAQQPTSDWRDEQWVLGYGLYVNVLVYIYLKLFGQHERANTLRGLINRLDIRGGKKNLHIHEGLVVPHKPYYALYAYKMYNNERFDLLGNSLAILSGITLFSRANRLINWIEAECEALRDKAELALNLPPCFLPYIKQGDPDWRDRYGEFNLPGEYHNGGVWPFICGFYVAALVATKKYRLAEKKLGYLTALVKPARDHAVSFGFNEWFKAQNGRPYGQDWQTWSAAMYLYAAFSVEQRKTPFFEEIRGINWTA